MPKAWLEEIFERFSSEVLAYLRLMLRDDNLAEDVLQNVFLRTYKYKVQGNEIEKIKPFLFQIARREAWREMQKRKPVQPLEDFALFEVAEEKVSSLDAICLEEVLKSLPEEQREIIYLKIYGSFTFQEISNMLNISINTAASRYRYAIDKMKLQMEEASHDETR